jgi:autotransporter-associated beta strand protein
MQRRTAFLLSSAVALSRPGIGWAATGPGKPARGVISIAELSTLRLNIDAVDTEPINGFVPQVVMGLTNEQDDDSEYSGVEGFGIQSSAPGGSSLPMNPTGAAPLYVVATLDSGSSGDILSYDSAQAYDLPDAGLIDGGSQTTTISGASGDEDVTITNALGVYATDFSHASVNSSGALAVSSGSLQGQYNVPILVGNQGDGLPNIVGSPILSQYRATIQNSVPQHLTVGGVVSQTPKVTLSAFSTTIPAGYSKLTLKAFDSASGDSETEGSPYYYNFELNGPTDPDIPGVWASFLTNGGVGISRNGTSATNQNFLLDTGAQVSVISNDEAASVGIFNASAATADFTEQVQGVGGITEVPGYYLNTLTLLTQGGLMTWNRVPVLVLDVADPRDPTSALPGILGTDLFSDRDLILNANVGATAQTYLAIGPQMQWQQSSGGIWSNASNWAVVLPNGIDMQANFYGAITSPSTITVDQAFTVGRITFDNSNRYTLSGTGPITLSDSTDASEINVRTGSHTIATPVTLASDTTITVIPTTSTLTVSSSISSSGNFGITQSGFGTLLLSASNTYAGATNVSSGTVTITGSIASTNVSTAIGATLNAAGAVNAGLSKSTVLISDGVANIGPNANTSGPAAVTLASIEIGSDPASKVTLLSSPLHANRMVLVTSGISFDSTSAGQLDLKDNDMVIHGSTLAAVQLLVKSGLNQAGGGYWNGPGIASSTAASDTSYLTTLAVIQNDNGSGNPLYSTASGSALGSFDGQTTTTSDILIKYTYYGDANLDGKVNGSDYSRIDNGYLTHLTGWYNGDFNYDGIVNGSDYTLIDNAFNRQSARLSDEIAAVTAQIAGSDIASPQSSGTSVPEPASGVMLSAAGIALLRRRRRK